MPVGDDHPVGVLAQFLVDPFPLAVITVRKVKRDQLPDVGQVGDAGAGFGSQVLGADRLVLVLAQERRLAEQGMGATGKPAQPVDVLGAVAEIRRIDHLFTGFFK